MTTTPIRVGIIGLSPGTWGANAHLPYLQSAESKFKIVAVCNSSAESSAKSIGELGLSNEVKAYGNVQDIANDKEVDLVVCTTRVDRHYASILPSLQAGKNIFVEWPLGKNLEEAKELLSLAKQNNVKLTAVGLQGRFDDTITTIKKLLAGGRIGKVLSSSVVSQGGIAGQTEFDHQVYLTDREFGGNLVTIPGMHLLDSVWEALGEISTFHSIVSNKRPTIKLISSDGSTVKQSHPKTSPDHVLLHGTLASGALLSFTLRGGAPFKDAQGLEWNIYGEKGEIRIRGPGAFVGINGGGSVQLHDFETDEVESVELEREGGLGGMVEMNRNVARVYEAIAVGDKETLCDFEGAVRRHEFIAEMERQNLLV